MIIKLAGIALAEIVIYSLLKTYKPEFAVISEVACGVLILFAVGSEISDIKAFFDGAALSSEIEFKFTEVLLKALGTALIAQLAADSARDNGQSALAEKIEFAGKVLILALSLPILKAVLQMITEFSKNR